MSISGRMDPKALLQELKTNRKTQIALGGLALVLIYSIYSLVSDPSNSKPKKSSRNFTVPIADRQMAALQKLPDLARLNQVGELPGDDHMYRDLFTFDMPAPPPVKVKPVPPPPPPPPPTPEQLAAEKLRKDRESEMNIRPQTLKYLGYMGTASSGRLGDFLKGEDPVTIRLGDLANPHWRLQTLNENFAEFQNLKYPDLRYRIEAGGTKPGGETNTTASNF